MSEKTPLSWIDITVPIRKAMVHWPGDPPVNIERIKEIGRGDNANLSQITMGSHSGTHVDAPRHFIEGGQSIDKMPLEMTIGRARVIEISDQESIKPQELKGHHIRRGERLLFKTRNSGRVWRSEGFTEDFVFISDEAARFLVARGVKVVGVDYLSVGSYRWGGKYVHQTLLGGGVWLIEGLDLSGVNPGRYELICLPLKISGGDGAPARVVLRPH
ncbi:cyclase family protein [Chloroflexota bacterium]